MIKKCVLCENNSITEFCPICQQAETEVIRERKCDECGQYRKEDNNCMECAHDKCIICGERVSYTYHRFCRECYYSKKFIATGDDEGFWLSDSIFNANDLRIDEQIAPEIDIDSILPPLKTEDESEALPSMEIDYRKRYPAKFRCNDGHYVRSTYEKILDDWLYDHGIIHSYENKIVYGEDDDDCLIPDFYLPKTNIYIELWGNFDRQYSDRKEVKKQIYRELEIALIEIEDYEIKIIDDIMGKLVIKYKLK